MPATIPDFELAWAMQPAAFAVLSREMAARGGEEGAFVLPPLRITLKAEGEEDELPYELVDGVAVIPIEGVISRDGGYWWDTGASLKGLRAALDHALVNPEVRGVLFAIHSPGGQATGVKEMADAIFEARRVKPCAAFADGLCCSAAYWLASSTGAVYAGPSATVGSIGVILRHMDKSGLNEQWGLKFTYVTAGSYKAVGNPDSALSERDMAVLQERVNALYVMFTGDVAGRMGLSAEQHLAWADGRDFLAAEAEALGLVTAITPSRADAIKKLLKETFMDKTELAAKHPGLLAEVQREAAEAARKDMEETAAKQSAAAVANLLHLMAEVCGKEAADKISALLACGVTPEQLQAVRKIVEPGQGENKEEARPSGAEANARILSLLMESTPNALADGGGKPGGDETLAAVKRMAAL
jgi:signal peptide peptidase SppA